VPWSYYRRKLHKASGSSLAKTKEMAVSFHRKKRKKRQAAIARYLFFFFFARNYLSITDTRYADTGMGTAIRRFSKNKDTPIR